MVSRGYFTLGSRFSRLPVNFFPVICLRLGGRRNGREEWGKKKKKGRMATDVLPLWQNANRELGFLPPSLRKLGKLNRYIPRVSWINTKLCLRLSPMPTPLLFILSSLISPVDRCLCIGWCFRILEEEGGREAHLDPRNG